METPKKHSLLADLSIREAVASDAAAIAALLGELGYPTTTAKAQQRIKQLRSPEDRVILAVVRGEVIGFVSVHLMPLIHEDGLLCRITALVVKETFRNRKAGTKLLEEVESFARRSGCVRLELTSGDQRTAAHRFYLRNGFRIHSQRFLKFL